MSESGMPLEKIMLVEDEEDIRAVAELALEAVGGFTLKACHSGANALENLDDFRPQLILLDVRMPTMDGQRTLRAIRQKPEVAQTPAAFMTDQV